MSVPEGKMRLDLGRHEVWLLASLLNDVCRETYGHHIGSEALRDLVKPVLARMNDYLEATDGEKAAYLQPDA